MKRLVLTMVAGLFLMESATAQTAGSVHYTGRSTPYTGQMTPVYTGRTTPYTGQMTPVYTGRTTPVYTGGNIPSGASKAQATIRHPGRQEGSPGPQPFPFPSPVPPQVGEYAATLPARYRTAFYRGYYYYYGNGSYYRAPASGQATDTIIDQHDSSVRRRYNDKDIDTEKTLPELQGEGERFEVVLPPLGLIVDELPVGASQVKKGLYQHQDVHYRPTYHEGKVKYMVSNP